MAVSWDKPEGLCLTPSSGSTRNLHAAKARLRGAQHLWKTLSLRRRLPYLVPITPVWCR